MCGIIGYTGTKNAVDKVITGLHALEYRGYDSAGIAYFDNDGNLTTVKAKGKIENVEKKIAAMPAITTHCAIGHTRWATHGAPSDENSHPHGTAHVQLVHNGIIENYEELRQFLKEQGYTFYSDTDTEVAAKLIDCYYKQYADPVTAIRKTEEKIRGSYAFGVLFCDEPDKIYAVRRESPLPIGIGKNENFIASDLTAFLPDTNHYFRLDQGEIAIICKDNITFLDKNNLPVAKKEEVALWDMQAAERGGFSCFMEKEMNEEPDAIVKTLSPRIRDGLPDFRNDGLDEKRLSEAKKITVVACGTAYHAGYYGKYLIEKIARIPAHAEIASEFRYSDPLIGKNDVVLIISQSGETADSLAALRLAKQAGAYVIAVVNVIGSSIAREADAVLPTLAGPEIAVASTKAYTVQTALLSLLAVKLALLSSNISEEEAREKTALLLTALPDAVRRTLALSDAIRGVASTLIGAEDVFFIGRNTDYVTALEGSLKLKEISYIHSEAYAAGELKHGTISLIEDETPVIALSTVESVREKTISNMKEVLARGATLYTIGTPSKDVESLATVSIVLPPCNEFIAPIVSATALQLLAYHVASLRGCDVDRPRNLAKSVTVE